MNDPQLAAALRSRSPDALPELLDTYGDRLFSYCWRLLRNRENAQIAVRDALVVAVAQIGHLVCDEWLGLWLYSLARAECLRREAVPASDADEPVCLPQADDADSRLMTWKAVTSMPADEVEALELESRPDVELRLVLGLSAAEVQELLDRARRDLERALGTEVLVRKSQSCPELSAMLSGWTGATTPALRDRVLEHAATCSVCGPHLPRSVSPARLFALLPAPALSSVARLEILEFFDDSRMAAYREFAVSRAEELTGSWFLSTPAPSEPASGSWFIPAPKPANPVPASTPEPAAPAPVPEATDRTPETPEPATAFETPDLDLAPDPDPVLEPVSPALRLAPEPAASTADAATGPIGSGPLVAQGFMGSWLSLAESGGSGPGPVTEPIPPVSVPAPRPEASLLAPVPAPPASRPAPAQVSPAFMSAPVPVPAASRPAPAPASGACPPAPAPAPAFAPAASRPVPASAPGPVRPGSLAPVIPLAAQPSAGPASPRASRPAAATRPARRRPRVSRVGVATMASVAVTVVFALVGFHVTPSASTGGSPPSAAAEGPGSVTAAPAGGADAALPVKVKRSPGGSSSARPVQQSAANKTGSLAVTAASQPGTSSPSQAGRSRTRAASSSSASPSSSSKANGSLAVSPARLDLGRGTTGELTLTAMNGPVSWSADTSSAQVTLSGQQGTLQAGQSVTLTVTVASGSGDEFVFVYSSPLTSGATVASSAAPSAGQAVEVTWTSYRSRGPQPSPSPSDSSSPSPSASPAPSSVMSGS